MIGPWATAFNRALARGHDHGSAAHVADGADKRAASKCPSTHCNRSGECRSPRECSAQIGAASFDRYDAPLYSRDEPRKKSTHKRKFKGSKAAKKASRKRKG